MASLENCKIETYQQQNRAACDSFMQEYCNTNSSEKNVCGCSSNAFSQVPDPKLGKLNPKCWFDGCSTNSNAYRFKFNDDECPAVCISTGTINVIGSNMTDTELLQSSCSGVIKKDDTASQQNTKKIEELKKYVAYGGITSTGLIVCVCITMIILSSLVLSK